MNDPMNPYASPSTTSGSLDPRFAQGAVIPAGQGARFLNLIIDYFAQLAVGAVVGVLFVVIGGDAGARFLEDTPNILIGIPIFLAYYWLLEATTSKTLGKMITGTKVVNEDGGRPTLGQITGRTFARAIPFEAFSFFGTPPRGWHDSLPKTFVIKSR